MQEFPINYLAILVAAISKMIVGMAWYSPALFAKPWMKLTGVSETEMKSGLGKALVVDFISNFIMAFVLLHAIHYAGASKLPQGLAVSFFNWIGLIAASSIGTVTFEKRPLKLFLINNGFQLLSLLIMGGILTAWNEGGL